MALLRHRLPRHRLPRHRLPACLALLVVLVVVMSAGSARAARHASPAVAGAPAATGAATETVVGAVVGAPGARAQVRAALQGIRFDWRRLGYRVVVIAGRRPQRAVTDNTARTITLFLRPGQPVVLTRKVLAYEFGHVVDFWYDDLASRRAWLRLRGARPGARWWAPDGAPEWRYGSGDFADAFSAWVTGSRYGYVSQVAGPPSAAQVRALQRLLRRSPPPYPVDAAP